VLSRPSADSFAVGRRLKAHEKRTSKTYTPSKPNAILINRLISLYNQLSLIFGICKSCGDMRCRLSSPCPSSADSRRNLAICIHFFFTAAFTFFFMESIHMYSMVARTTRRMGMLSNLGNFVCGWGFAITVIAFSISFEYNSYGSVYQ
jgi:hypothetical protein